MLFLHLMRAAASRTFCTAGSNNPISMAMIAMTTSNSISVKAEMRERELRVNTVELPGAGNNAEYDSRNEVVQSKTIFFVIFPHSEMISQFSVAPEGERWEPG